MIPSHGGRSVLDCDRTCAMFAKPDDNDDKAGCDNQMEALLLLSLSLSKVEYLFENLV